LVSNNCVYNSFIYSCILKKDSLIKNRGEIKKEREGFKQYKSGEIYFITGVDRSKIPYANSPTGHANSGFIDGKHHFYKEMTMTVSVTNKDIK
jgi:hypothetical protein